MPPARKVPPRSKAHLALGEEIRRRRVYLGLSQERLAFAVETDVTQIGGIERGVRNPSYTTLLRIAKALSTSVGQLAIRAEDHTEGEGCR